MNQQERNNAERLAFVYAANLVKTYRRKAEFYRNIALAEAIIVVGILVVSWWL